MSGLADELRQVAASLRSLHEQGQAPVVRESLERIEDTAFQAAKAWSGSSLGYQSCVYYADLKPAPPGTHFSQEWGFGGTFQGTTGHWREYSHDDVYHHILASAGADLSAADKLAAEAERAVDEARSTVESIFAGWIADHQGDAFMAKLKESVEAVQILSSIEATELQISAGQVMTRDMIAASQGPRAAPRDAATPSDWYADLTSSAPGGFTHPSADFRPPRAKPPSRATQPPWWLESTTKAPTRTGAIHDGRPHLPTTIRSAMHSLTPAQVDKTSVALIMGTDDATYREPSLAPTPAAGKREELRAEERTCIRISAGGGLGYLHATRESKTRQMGPESKGYKPIPQPSQHKHPV
jgi:hypothetical protein